MKVNKVISLPHAYWSKMNRSICVTSLLTEYHTEEIDLVHQNDAKNELNDLLRNIISASGLESYLKLCFFGLTYKNQRYQS